MLVPEPEDVDRWSAIGVRPEAIRVTGSLKHDYEGLPEDPRTPEFAALLDVAVGRPLPPILLAASTHPGEETLLARVFLDTPDRPARAPPAWSSRAMSNAAPRSPPNWPRSG